MAALDRDAQRGPRPRRLVRVRVGARVQQRLRDGERPRGAGEREAGGLRARGGAEREQQRDCFCVAAERRRRERGQGVVGAEELLQKWIFIYII